MRQVEVAPGEGDDAEADGAEAEGHQAEEGVDEGDLPESEKVNRPVAPGAFHRVVVGLVLLVHPVRTCREGKYFKLKCAFQPTGHYEERNYKITREIRFFGEVRE